MTESAESLEIQLAEAKRERGEWRLAADDWQARFIAAVELGQREKAFREDAEARLEAVKAKVDESVHVLHPHASNPWQAALNDVRAALSVAPDEAP